MKTTKFLTAVMAIGIAATFFACTKGDTGATGPQGPAATNGINGANGVANIKDSIYTIYTYNWLTETNGFYVVLDNFHLTSSTTDGVEVFFSEEDVTWQGLPESYAIVPGDNLQYQYDNLWIQLNYYYASKPTITIYCKVVVIPPSVMAQHPNTNWKNYSEVQAIIKSQKQANQ